MSRILVPASVKAAEKEQRAGGGDTVEGEESQNLLLVVCKGV